MIDMSSAAPPADRNNIFLTGLDILARDAYRDPVANTLAT